MRTAQSASSDLFIGSNRCGGVNYWRARTWLRYGQTDMGNKKLRLISADDDPQPIRIPVSRPEAPQDDAAATGDSADEASDDTTGGDPRAADAANLTESPRGDPVESAEPDHDDSAEEFPPDSESDAKRLDEESPEPDAPGAPSLDSPSTPTTLSLADSTQDEVYRVPTRAQNASWLTVIEKEPSDSTIIPERAQQPASQEPVRVKRSVIKSPRHSKRRRRPAGKIVIAKKKAAIAQPESVLNDRYRLLNLIGEGGSGSVFKAWDDLLETEVAIKVLSPDLSTDPHTISTLKREAHAAMQLSNTHIVRLHNLERCSSGFFLVMEHVDGETLSTILRRVGSVKLKSVLDILDVCDKALTYAHRHHVVHGDIKPANMIMTSDGVLKLIDFGEAYLPGTPTSDGYWIAGTPYYMSPEKKQGTMVDHRSDIYALGITTYELLTGHVPYPAGLDTDTLIETYPQELPGLCGDIRTVVQHSIAIDRDARWASVHDFVSAMHAAAE